VYFLLAITMISPAFADTTDITIGSIGPFVHAGSRIEVPLYIHNTGDQPITFRPMSETTFQLGVDEKKLDLTAKITDPAKAKDQSIPPQGFLKVIYTVDLPLSLEGNVYLTAVELDDASIYFSVSSPSPKEKSAYAWIPRTTDQPLDALLRLYQPYVANISFYEPMYFLVGTEPENSKFQLSLKYRFFNPEKPFVQKHPWLQGFHFGYTQTSFWDLESASAPFEDTSYKPELFYTSRRLKVGYPLLDGVFLKGGVRHESNGRGDDFSRSTNTVYIEPIFLFYNEKRRTGLRLSPRVWTYVDNDDETNPNLDRYRGHFNLGLTFGKADSLVVDTNIGWAAEGGSIQVDLTYPLHTLFFNHLDMYFQVQYVNQLAESLIHYTKRTEAFRLGLAIVR
jgi:outer membrane phospholipase A